MGSSLMPPDSDVAPHPAPPDHGIIHKLSTFKIPFKVSRDRKGEFEPQTVKKRQTC